MTEFVKECGASETRIILKNDQEPAIEALMAEVVKTRGAAITVMVGVKAICGELWVATEEGGIARGEVGEEIAGRRQVECIQHGVRQACTVEQLR